MGVERLRGAGMRCSGVPSAAQCHRTVSLMPRQQQPALLPLKDAAAALTQRYPSIHKHDPTCRSRSSSRDRHRSRRHSSSRSRGRWQPDRSRSRSPHSPDRRYRRGRNRSYSRSRSRSPSQNRGWRRQDRSMSPRHRRRSCSPPPHHLPPWHAGPGNCNKAHRLSSALPFLSCRRQQLM